MKWLLPLLALCHSALAQQPPAAPPQPAQPSQAETDELRHELAEANTSEIEVLHVIESYLEKHPATLFRPDLEHRAALAAIAAHDDRRVVRYGDASLARMPEDTKLLPAVTASLLALGSPEAAARALQYSRRSEDLVRQMQKDGNPGNISPIEWRDQTDLLLNRALTSDARATGLLGRPQEALATAQRAFDTFPDAAAAREIAFWYQRLNKPADALRALADAFAIPDAKTTDAERAQDRQHLADLERQTGGTEQGLATLCLQAYDRTAALLKAREAQLHRGEPNAGRTDLLDFTLSGLNGKNLSLSSLRGKVVVMDLWATWCLPCREQHPLYEQVKARFQDNPAVVFLSLNSDGDRTLVKSFVSGMKWDATVYFEDGVAQFFKVQGLPATILLGRDGKLFTYLNGYVDKARFVDVLTERIRQALAAPAN